MNFEEPDNTGLVQVGMKAKWEVKKVNEDNSLGQKANWEAREATMAILGHAEDMVAVQGGEPATEDLV